MTPEIETPISPRESANPKPGSNSKDQIGGRRSRLHALRHESTGQFYVLSHEDRLAFNKHCQGIVEDLNPQSHRERWLATAIAEDQWRLDRARSIENNIFGIGMSGPIADATSADSPEVHAAACQARVWLQDGHEIQMVALYEQRIRRSVEKNERQLKEMQAERQAAYDKFLEEEKLLAMLALAGGEVYETEANGFGFSTEQITQIVRRELRLIKAREYQKQAVSQSQTTRATGFRLPTAA